MPARRVTGPLPPSIDRSRLIARVRHHDTVAELAVAVPAGAWSRLPEGCQGPDRVARFCQCEKALGCLRKWVFLASSHRLSTRYDAKRQPRVLAGEIHPQPRP